MGNLLTLENASAPDIPDSLKTPLLQFGLACIGGDKKGMPVVTFLFTICWSRLDKLRIKVRTG